MVKGALKLTISRLQCLFGGEGKSEVEGFESGSNTSQGRKRAEFKREGVPNPGCTAGKRSFSPSNFHCGRHDEFQGVLSRAKPTPCCRLEGDQFHKIRWCRSLDTAECKCGDFEVDSVPNRQPMKGSQLGSNVLHS